MTTDEKSSLIGAIMAVLRFRAKGQNKAFDEGDTFLALCFRTDDELKQIARECGYEM